MMRYSDLPATRFWITHYSNFCYLDFIAKNEHATWRERQQAQKEIQIAERKMAYWKKHPNFCQIEAERGKAKLDKEWKRG